MRNATADPAVWPNFSHRAAFAGQSPHPVFQASASADATEITTAPPRSANGGSNYRKALPRKRPRSTRRAPTTLLNTDTTNFRAMVQQFTGVSSGPFSTSYGQSAISFGFGAENRIQQPPAKRYDYRPPPQQQQEEEMMIFSSGPGLEEAEEMVMPGFFFDGMAGAGGQVVPGPMTRDGRSGGYY